MTNASENAPKAQAAALAAVARPMKMQQPAPRPVPLQPANGAPPPPAQSFLAGPIEVPSVGSRRLFSGLAIATFVLFVLLPVAIAGYYFAYVAADRYAVEVKFAIRSPGGLPTPDLLGMVTGATTAGSTQADSYMVVDFIKSRQFLDALSKRLDLKATYATDRADFLMRMPADATREQQVKYLRRMLSAYYDSTSQIITVEAQAFSPEDAQAMTEAVIAATSELINMVSERARQDTVRLAEAELARAEAALKAQRAAIALFRETEQQIDPTSTVAAQENVLAQLQGQLSRTLTEMSSLREFLAEDAPSVRVLRSQIDSIERQIIAERAQLGAGGATANGTASPGLSLNSALAQYEELIVDLEFRQRTYLSALASLELARVEADRQQRYVAAFVLPSFPEEAIYPQVKSSLALIAVVAFLIWGVTTMFIQIVREHLS
ncbi:hypothetical protein [Phaeovulum sp.]|uniref:hypothetical protein n=1 Tax=Phaeovulum sp. TaxID=2934796 RepID=UPI002731DA0A|nr:hypothetical protein [Phaeovulum sp.]MDP1667533.1 hypothetical protein [Phaeovulum sp.]MDZ4120050.1 hypothetical protein [Phaeovulum sp.]